MLAACSGGGSTLAVPHANSAGRPIAASASEQVVYGFTGGLDGGDAATDLTPDSSGNVYGTTVIGGYYNCGTVFKLVPRKNPPWQESVLYSFTCYYDGKNPYGGVTFDDNADMFGTTVSGGSGGTCGSTGCGAAWELHGSAETVLHSFTGGSDGFGPGGGVVMDRKNNLYGTTPDGGQYYSGVIYQLRQRNGSWSERVIHAFNGGSEGGTGSLGRLLIDRHGNLYGVTETGGAHSAGTAYKLSHAGGKWQLTTLYAFKGTPDCGSPYGGLIADRRGNLYGTTYYGGANGLGCVFELKNSNGSYEERVVYSFAGGNDGSSPTTTLLLVGKRTLYGTTSAGGSSCDCGTVFKLNAKTGAESVVHAFTGGVDGAYPYYGLLRESNGHLIGTTVAGGTQNQGVVFEITP
jgi:uncharacterized repeat protein (TIGR03803 family)